MKNPHKEIIDMIMDKYFQIIAGNGKDLLNAHISELRYCDRIRKPAIFDLNTGKRIFPSVNLPLVQETWSNSDPLLNAIYWAKNHYVKADDKRVVIARNSYMGGYVLE